MTTTELFECTQVGPDRLRNADRVAHWTVGDDVVFAVAHGFVLDNSGDPEAATEASTLALDVLGREIGTLPPAWPMRSRLQRGVQAANVELYQKALTVPELRPMRATLTVTALAGDAMASAHVGDCRLFLFRAGEFTQLSKDHTWAWDPLLAGARGREPVHGRARRYALPRCLGQELVLSIDVLTMTARAGDMFLQCTTGLHSILPDDDLREALEAHPPETACRALLRRARLADGRDDASVQVAVVGGSEPPPARGWHWFGR